MCSDLHTSRSEPAEKGSRQVRMNGQTELITQRSQVQILPPLPRSEARTCTVSGLSAVQIDRLATDLATDHDQLAGTRRFWRLAGTRLWGRRNAVAGP